ncbi:hypothetical protein IAT40_003925 [Kwoniella sp. CBS 6097]
MLLIPCITKFFLFTSALSISPLVSAQTCYNYGSPSSGSCLCPPGFNTPSSGSSARDCSLPVCGGSLYTPGEAAPGGQGGFGNISVGCGCEDGWTGPGCTVCQSDSACSSSLQQYLNSSNSLSSPDGLNSSLTCSKAPTVYSSSQLSCQVIQATLQALFPLDSTATLTRSLNSSRTPGGTDTLNQAGLTSADGTVGMQLWYNGVEQFYCSASDCAQSVKQDGDGNGGSSGQGNSNSSTWECPTMECTCRTGTMFCGGGDSPSQNLTGAINTLSGPLTVDCFSTGTCNFKQAFMVALFGQNGLELSSCSFGECVQQHVIDQALGITTSKDGNNGLSGGVIAGLAVVGAILLAIIGVVIWAFIQRKRARRELLADGVLKKSGGVGVNWSGVGYEIKPVDSSFSNKIHRWMKGSSNGAGKTSEREENGSPALAAGSGKVVLTNSSGSIPSGGFACILGPSGAGKSTLVDILAGKRKGGKVRGRVGFARADGAEGRVRVGYVDQSDILSPTSTVLETLLFAAHLRLPENIPSALKVQRAHTVLSQLHLDHIASTRIGSSEHRGISGGEARRISIGIELVASPDVLVLDEPTSGLDSVSAARLVRLLKSLAESGTTVIASIHQPSSALYHAFDQVMLLSQGRQLYFGPGGNTPKEYFEKKGQKCPIGYNVADYLLEIASGETESLFTSEEGTPTSHDDSRRNGSGDTSVSSADADSPQMGAANGHGNGITNLNIDSETPLAEKGLTYPPSPVRTGVLLKTASRTEGIDLAQLGQEQDKGRQWWSWPRNHCATTFLTQVEILSGREWRNLKRDKTLLIAHTLLACVLGVFAGGLYYKVDITIAGFQNRVGSLFFLGSLIAFSSLSALYNLVEVRGLFLRERAGDFYSPQAWLLSRVIFDIIPLRLIPTILVSIIVYFMVGLSHDAARFFKFLLIIVEFSLGMTLFNFLLACLFRHGGVAILLSSLCNLFLMTYAGFFVNISQIPPVLRWLRYFSTLGYTLEALTINEVGSGLQIVDSLNGVRVEIGATIIMQTLFGFGLDNYYRDVLVLFAFIAGFGVILVGIVVYFLRERR